MNHVLWFWTEGLNDCFCRRSCWRACLFGWFSIFWIYCRTLVFCVFFTMECGSPGISKSVSASILSRIISLLMLIVSASLKNFRVILCCNCVFTRSPWSITNWIWNWLGWLEEFCLSNNFPSWLSNFPLLVVDQLWNQILLSSRDVVKSLVEVEVTCMLSHLRLLQSSIWQLLEYNKLEVFLEVAFDRV